VGAALAKNIRRTGTPATKRGRPNPEYLRSVFEGPTAERLAKAESHFTIGDDKQGTRIYHFHDSALDRLYSRLTKAAKTQVEEEKLRSEYIALQRYKHHWHHAGLQSSLSSMTLDRIFAPDPGAMSGMAKSEKQAHHRQQWRAARDLLGHQPGIVVDNIVCADQSIEVTGYAIGYETRTSARDNAERILRESARKLAKLWGVG
jgi:hypothetical protein